MQQRDGLYQQRRGPQFQFVPSVCHVLSLRRRLWCDCGAGVAAHASVGHAVRVNLDPVLPLPWGFFYAHMSGSASADNPDPSGLSATASVSGGASFSYSVTFDEIQTFQVVYSASHSAQNNFIGQLRVNNSPVTGSGIMTIRSLELRLDGSVYGSVSRRSRLNGGGITYGKSDLPTIGFATQTLRGLALDTALETASFASPAALPTDDLTVVGDLPATIANELGTPVLPEYGVGSFLFLEFSLNRNQLFEADGGNFSSFTIPTAAGGDSEFILSVGDETYAMTAGETFSFTVLDPAGVNRFRLFDLSDDNSEEEPSFTAGFQFAEEGSVLVTRTPIAIPGDSNEDLLVDLADLNNSTVSCD